jgi:hypothetical protein
MFEKHTHEASYPSQGKGRPQIAVGFKSELPFEIARAESRGSEVIRRKDISEGAAIGITERPLSAQCGHSTKARRMLSAKKTTFGWNRLLPTASFWD